MNIRTICRHLLLCISLCGLGLVSLPGYSQTQLQGQEVYQTFGDYRVYFSVFNSSFIQPDIAAIYHLERGKDRALVNIAVTRKQDSGYTQGLEADLKGYTTNLMQQQKNLDFSAIREQDAVYYLAPIRFTDEEILHFTIEVTLTPGQPPVAVNFTRKLYVDR